MRRVVTNVFLGLVSAAVMSGCNTIEGIGRDVKKGGEVIEKASEKAKS
jgi:predicted small secreted protein